MKKLDAIKSYGSLKVHNHPVFVKTSKFVSSADQSLKISAFINNRKWDKKADIKHIKRGQQLCVIMH